MAGKRGKNVYRMPWSPLSAINRAVLLYRSKTGINHTQLLDLNRKTSRSAPGHLPIKVHCRRVSLMLISSSKLLQAKVITIIWGVLLFFLPYVSLIFSSSYVTNSTAIAEMKWLLSGETGERAYCLPSCNQFWWINVTRIKYWVVIRCSFFRMVDQVLIILVKLILWTLTILACARREYIKALTCQNLYNMERK